MDGRADDRRLRLRAGALHRDDRTIDDAYLCHCRMCQRATGSVSIAFKNVKQADVAWEHEPDWYDSSPIAERPYCRECGTSLGFRFKDGSENMDLTVASFDDPSRVQAQASFRRREHAPRLAQHRGPARNPHRGLSEAGRQMGRGDRASFPDERRRRSIAGPPRTASSSPITRLGEGRPVVLLHGLFSDANMNWIKFGHAARIAAAGFRVIMPDLRAHGLSGKPHEPSIIRKGILARDLRELVAHLGARPSSTSAASRSARGRRSRRSARGCGRAARSSAAPGSRACATGSGARTSSSRRSSCSTRSSAATRTGCRSSS